MENEEKKVGNPNILGFHQMYKKPELCVINSKSKYKLLNHLSASILIDDGLKAYFCNTIHKIINLNFLPVSVIIEKMNLLAKKVYEIELQAYENFEKHYNAFYELEKFYNIDYEEYYNECKDILENLEKDLNKLEENGTPISN